MRTGKPRTGERAARVRIPVERSSGNVFEDLGLPDSAQLLAKSEIAARIASIIARRGLTQAGAAQLLDIDQPGVSALVRGRLRGFSSDRLLRFLNALGQDVEIVLRGQAHPNRAGRLRVTEDVTSQALVAGSRARR